MKTPHKHAELIKAWADGAEIEVFLEHFNEWVACPRSAWDSNYEYRIKPEPKPDFVEEMTVYRNLVRRFQNERPAGEGFHPRSIAEMRLTWDGETGKLKSAEVL